ncbi:uncharacterized protein LOC131676345 isoform X2 [Topomyia yanbarensis]|uniref:uncharacterized protein LOC131676345 isoform X2 n=1 Tax=Topomyia yanbarensis TaxID=2498891 RepID=UPI00273B34EB|nr:uncharacterized protein LOC131676345 isoform X2 [Topomyia yanbarensis]
MTATRKSSVLLGLLILFSISLKSNNAAPTSKQTDSSTSSEIRSGNGLNQNVDEEVLELEHLKHQTSSATGANTKEEILPQLEKQLEEEAQASASIVSSDEDSGGDNDEDDTANDEEDDSSNDYAEKLAKVSESMLLKTLAEYHHKQQRQQHIEDQHNHLHITGEPKVPESNHLLLKLLPGASRFSFGQHNLPEITTPIIPKTTAVSQPEEVPKVDPELTSLTKNGQRRGDAEVLLRHSGGQYSAFDMAQYVFWTGDEAGVARGVEELIQKGLMTRENAIKFLRDIRLGIDYLQNTYSSRSLKTDHQSNSEQDHYSSTAMTTVTEPPTTVITHTEAVVANDLIETQATLSPEILKVIERLPSLLKINDLTDQTESTQDYDDVVGRLRLADFLYAEYSLEEVIYQLAKVMFTQSLTRGSEPAQHALEKLTAFLESEGTHGRISPVLQKKILDVLLAALADTLADNPELMKAARLALGKHIEKLPQRSEKH